MMQIMPILHVITNKDTINIVLTIKRQLPMYITLVSAKLKALASFSLQKVTIGEKLTNAKRYVMKIIMHKLTNSRLYNL